MFGKNKPLPQLKTDGRMLRIKEIFPTIQGEGPLAGTPAIFIRLEGCNLRCAWCDTSFEDGEGLELPEIMDRVRGLHNPSKQVVLTGGEPLRQNISQLIRALNNEGYRVQIETAGTLWFDDLDEIEWGSMNTIVVSPKIQTVHKKVRWHGPAWKYIIREGEIDETDGLPNRSTQEPGKVARIARPWDVLEVRGWTLEEAIDNYRDNIFLQPCDEHDPAATKKNMILTAALAMKFGYRVSLQMHKILDLP